MIIFRLNDKPTERETESPKPTGTDREIIASDLVIPWDLELLPDSRILVTERPGNLLIIGADKQIIKVEGVRHTGEGGLLGLAIHPDFENNNFIYLYLTSDQGGRITNRVERYRLERNSLLDRTVIASGIRGASFHDGRQIEFGPPTPNGSGQADYYLYIATGDSGQGNLAQDTNSLNGKILRVKDDGSDLEIYSYGHRNVQGLAWDEQGRLWATEHGPSGIDGGIGMDELNLIVKGGNYGWPVIKGEQTREGMISPVIQSGSRETWAPSGMAFFEGRLYFAGLRGETLYSFNPATGELKKHFAGEYGRLRAVKAASDGIYFTTSNRDGRGEPQAGDDKLIFIRDTELLK